MHFEIRKLHSNVTSCVIVVDSFVVSRVYVYVNSLSVSDLGRCLWVPFQQHKSEKYCGNRFGGVAKCIHLVECSRPPGEQHELDGFIVIKYEQAISVERNQAHSKYKHLQSLRLVTGASA